MKGFQSQEEFKAAPTIIQHLWACGMDKQAIGSSLYELAIRDHPEYFEEELERRRIWATIPQEVHTKYMDEILLKVDGLYAKMVGKTIGLWEQMHMPQEELSKYLEERDKKLPDYNKERKKIEKEIHDKYYASYVLKYNRD